MTIPRSHIALITSAALVLSVIGVFGLHVAFAGPTVPPPGNNVAAPLNQGDSQQRKSGILQLGGSSQGATTLIVENSSPQNAALTVRNFSSIANTALNVIGALTAQGGISSTTSVSAPLIIANPAPSANAFCIGTACIKAWADVGGGGGVPEGAIMLFDRACPSGWSPVTQLEGRVPLGAATGRNPGEYYISPVQPFTTPTALNGIKAYTVIYCKKGPLGNPIIDSFSAQSANVDAARRGPDPTISSWVNVLGATTPGVYAALTWKTRFAESCKIKVVGADSTVTLDSARSIFYAQTSVITSPAATTLNDPARKIFSIHPYTSVNGTLFGLEELTFLPSAPDPTNIGGTLGDAWRYYVNLSSPPPGPDITLRLTCNNSAGTATKDIHLSPR